MTFSKYHLLFPKDLTSRRYYSNTNPPKAFLPPHTSNRHPHHAITKTSHPCIFSTKAQWQLLPCSPSRQYTTRWYVIFYHPSPPGPALLTSAPNSRLDGRRPHNLPHRPRRHRSPNPPSHRQHLSMSLSRRILTLKSSKAKNIHHGYEGF